MAVLAYRDLVKRIRAAQKTQQITKTMQMVSASRLRRSQEKLSQSKPYLEKIEVLFRHLQDTGIPLSHPFLATRDVKSSALVIVASDRGLCGAYNANIIHFAESHLEAQPHRNTQLILIGKKIDDYFKKRCWPIFAKYLDVAGKIDFAQITQITNRLTDAYLRGQFDSIDLVYTRFKSALSIQPALIRLLPLHGKITAVRATHASPLRSEPVGTKTYLEPSCEAILENLLPMYVSSRIYVSLIEAATAENSARMIAMKNATDNAKEMIRRLTLLRNKARQATITKELLEIVTAGEAIKG